MSCANCYGSGRILSTAQSKCNSCFGQGRAAHNTRETCGSCGGTGSFSFQISKSCPNCIGTGGGGGGDVRETGAGNFITGFIVFVFIVFFALKSNTSTNVMQSYSVESTKDQLSPEQLSNQENAKTQVSQFVHQDMGASFAGEVWNRDAGRRDFIKRIVRTGNAYDYCRLKSAADAVNEIKEKYNIVKVDQTEHYVQVMYRRFEAICVRDTGSRPYPYLDVLKSEEISRELIGPAVNAITALR